MIFAEPTYELLTPSEAAEELGVSEATIRTLLARRQLQPVRAGGGRIKVARSELEALRHRRRP